MTFNIQLWYGGKYCLLKLEVIFIHCQVLTKYRNWQPFLSFLYIHSFVLLEKSGEQRFMPFILRITVFHAPLPSSPRVCYASLSVQWTTLHYILYQSVRYASESYWSEILRLSTVLFYGWCQNKGKFKINKATTLIYNLRAHKMQQHTIMY
jgi:hypothetical protein